MTQVEDRYSRSSIYKLVSSVDDKIYVGCTTSPNLRRVYYNHWEKNRIAHFNTIGWKCVQLVQLEWYPCADRFQLLSRHQYWINKLKPSLNPPAKVKARVRKRNKTNKTEEPKKTEDIKLHHGRRPKHIKMHIKRGTFIIY